MRSPKVREQLQLEGNQLQYLNATEIYYSDLLTNGLKHMSALERAVYIWLKPLTTVEMLVNVAYMGAQNVSIPPHRFTNVVNTIPRFSATQFDHGNDLT